MDDVIRGRLKGALMIKKAHYMAVMRSAFWAQGWWFVEDPVLSGLEFRGLMSFKGFFFFFFLVNLTQGHAGWSLLTSAVPV